jgi:hypothetical protein
MVDIATGEASVSELLRSGGVRGVAALGCRIGPLSASSAFGNNDPAIFLTFRAGCGLEASDPNPSPRRARW